MADAGSPLTKSASGYKGRPQWLRARGDGATMPFDFPIRAKALGGPVVLFFYLWSSLLTYMEHEMPET